jgi:CRISPR-associated protein Cas5d
MPHSSSPLLHIRARGPLACFTRPELKVERVSYPVMTPSAARGLLDAVLWKPAIQWRIRRIRVLNEIAFTSFRRNEVTSTASSPPLSTIQNGGPVEHFFADDVDAEGKPRYRAQRNTVALRDVDYIVSADFFLTTKAGPADNMTKFVEMFQRRVEKGQHFHQPYFGCREFAADISSATGEEITVPDSRDLGLMLWDIAFSPNQNRPIFFHARLDRGVMEIPENPEQERAA